MTTAGNSLPGATRAAMATAPCPHQQVFPALAEQVGHARRFLAGLLMGYPMADEAVLCLSELASNTIIHSASRQPGGTFTVRAVIDDDGGVRVEVEDQGGLWGPSSSKNGSTATDCTSSASSPATGESPATAQQAGLSGLSCSAHDRLYASHRQSTTPRK